MCRENCSGTDLPEEESGGEASVFIRAHFLVTRAFTVVDVYVYYSQVYLGSEGEGVGGRKGGAISLPSTRSSLTHLLLLFVADFFLITSCDTSSLLSVAIHLFIRCFLFFICAKVQKLHTFFFR